ALKAEMARGHRRLPDLALAELPIAQHHEGAIAPPGDPPRQRHAEPDREPMPQRARGEVDSRHLLHVRMVAEGAAEARVLVQKAWVEEAQIRQHGIEADGGVAFR